MTTALRFAAGNLPAADTTRYGELLVKHPQLRDQSVLQLSELVVYNRGRIAHPRQARDAKAPELKGEIVAALAAEGDLSPRTMQVVDNLVQVLMDTPVPG